ncbi:MAG: Ppx/GppA family phosphatase [Armatimonadetes bacterium]|nr:Ppx/GppA family phosphatase [Armatimonadota bacterium]MDW8154466.1 Ppx/GppA phosphatase family protein [Armatimonadota bacterium]
MRRAAIDIGTNSVRLLVAEVENGRITPLTQRMEITRLGEGLAHSPVLAPQAIGRTVRAVREFAEMARALGAESLVVFGTSALREAHNRATLERDLKPLRVRILTGEQEAELSFFGALVGLPDLRGRILVLDVGGGSTELTVGTRERIESRVSLPLGAVRMTERFIRSDPAAEVELEALSRTAASLLSPYRRTFLRPDVAVGVGGTATTLVAVDQALEPYDPARVHGTRLTQQKVSSMARGLCAMPLALRRRLPGLQPQRADVICAGAVLLATLLRELEIPELLVSESDLLWGALLRLR